MSDTNIFKTLEDLVKQRKANPEAGSYTAELFNSGLARIAQKVGEEGVEVVIAAMKKDRNELINESTDLIYHLLVLLVESGVDLSDIEAEVAKRRKIK